MNPQKEKDILTYLEGEIKYNEEHFHIEIIRDGVKELIAYILYPNGRIITESELGYFIATALTNERERRKEQAKKVLLFCVVANEGEGMNQLSIWFEKYEDAKTFKESCIKRYPNCCIISKQYLITPKKEEE